MNLLEITAECIWWMLHITANSVLALLEINYSIVALFIHVIQILVNIIVEFSSSLFDILKSCYYDFLAFSSELALCINFIFTTVINFISRRVNEICYFSYYVTDYITCIFTGILTATNESISLLNEIFHIILYFVTVIFRAVLMLLQLGPNLLIFLYEITIHCCKQSWELLLLAIHSLWKNIYVLPFECQKIMCNVPLKAYFGLLLLISLFHARHVIKRYLENFSMIACNQCVALWFNTLPKTIANIILLYKRCQKYLFPEKTESNTAVPGARGLRKRTQLAFQYFQGMLNVLKVPISRVSEELSDHELQELQKKLYAEKERRICVICQDRERSVLLYPCGHMCVCEECTNAIRQRGHPCPICRQDIIDTLKVYT